MDFSAWEMQDPTITFPESSFLWNVLRFQNVPINQPFDSSAGIVP